ncbi:AMP-binding protein [Amycolatopsis pithecellobii]|uniref:AMP-binding protein n=1 Tax=Amycolatopsis pithecellobii TaxID=664692 RepID=UPI001AA02BFC|nr:AMP-binding protein [Amycolatopsis pithecellobii]
MIASGSTEYPTAVSSGPDDPLGKRAKTDGRALGAVGELWLRGPEMFLGYLDSELDEEAFTSDGWVRTGDLATMDEDGFVTIADSGWTSYGAEGEPS